MLQVTQKDAIPYDKQTGALQTGVQFKVATACFTLYIRSVDVHIKTRFGILHAETMLRKSIVHCKTDGRNFVFKVHCLCLRQDAQFI